MPKNEMVAMILAGGKGTRLEALTKKECKPAVPFGGKYRIIDFPISNAVHSGITHIGVLTQYESISLNNYCANGAHWGLDGNKSFMGILAPRQKESGLDWYSGTANAIANNIDFLDDFDPEYVLILSGDHIYKMDYAKMLEAHKKNKADLTVAVLNVTLEEASRFGIMNTDKSLRVVEFEEKPKNPKSTLASMGIYIFSYQKLRGYLAKSLENNSVEYDFGKHVIPSYINDGLNVFAYQFDGYWKDVGTIASLWQANMDLLDSSDSLGLYKNDGFKILTEDNNAIPEYIGPNGEVTNSLVNQGAVILGTVKNSVVFSGAYIGEGAVVTDSVVMPNVVINKNARIHNAIVKNDVVIAEGRKENENGTSIVLISE